jgi:plastocyanin
MTPLRTVILGLLTLTVAATSPLFLDAYAGKLITIDVGVQGNDTACDGETACFIPYHTTVFAGEPVSFHNTDEAVHTLVFGDPTVTIDLTDMKVLGVGDTYNRTFVVPGDHYYYCSLHPWKTGVLDVKIADVETLHKIIDDLETELRQKNNTIEEMRNVIKDMEDELELVRKNFKELLD